MGDQSEEIEEYADRTWKLKTLAVGTLIGAVAGLAGAFLLTRRAEKNETTVAVTPTDGIKIGLLVFGLLRSLGKLGED
jgi:ABC-type Mn2+/Zn2+ transport system permease subunit